VVIQGTRVLRLPYRVRSLPIFSEMARTIIEFNRYVVAARDRRH
jgi:hypothetical protein